MSVGQSRSKRVQRHKPRLQISPSPADPNIAIVRAPDPWLSCLTEIYKPGKEIAVRNARSGTPAFKGRGRIAVAPELKPNRQLQ